MNHLTINILYFLLAKLNGHTLSDVDPLLMCDNNRNHKFREIRVQVYNIADGYDMPLAHFYWEKQT